MSHFEGLEDIDVVAVIDGATATTYQAFPPVFIRSAPARLLGTMGRALQAEADLYLPSDRCILRASPPWHHTASLVTRLTAARLLGTLHVHPCARPQEVLQARHGPVACH